MAALVGMAAFLFDFDGTLADSFDTIVTTTNRLAPEFGFEPVAPAELARLKHLSTRQLLWQSQISLLQIPALLRRVRAELHQAMPDIQPFPGLPDAIAALHAQRHWLAIVTTNTVNNVQVFLAAHDLTDYFSGIDGGGSLLGKGRLIRRSLRRYDLNPSQVIYVGDEVRDIEAARQAGVAIAGVAWGFNSREALLAANPDWLLESPSDLQAIADAV